MSRLKILFSYILLGSISWVCYEQYLTIKNLQTQLDKHKFTSIDEFLNSCRFNDLEYISAYTKGRKDQLDFDIQRYTQECLAKLKNRKCQPFNKELLIMSDGSEVKKKTTKKRGRRKKKAHKKVATDTEQSATEPAEIEVPELDSKPAEEEKVSEAPTVEAMSEEDAAVKEVASAEPESPEPKSTAIVSEEGESEYPLGARFWFTRHTHLEGVLVPPGTIYEVVESAPEDALTLGGGKYKPIAFRLVRGAGPQYFVIIGRHTALERI